MQYGFNLALILYFTLTGCVQNPSAISVEQPRLTSCDLTAQAKGYCAYTDKN